MLIIHCVGQTKIRKYTIDIIVYLIERHFYLKYGIPANANIKVGKGLQIVQGTGLYFYDNHVVEYAKNL